MKLKTPEHAERERRDMSVKLMEMESFTRKGNTIPKEVFDVQCELS